MSKRLTTGIAIFITLFWSLLIVLDYWHKHPFQFYALDLFAYYPLFLGGLVVGGGLSAVFLYLPSAKRFFNGLSLFVLGMFLIAAYSVVFVQTELYPDGLAEGASYLLLFTKVLRSFLYAFFILISCYVAGALILDRISMRLRKRHRDILRIASGIFAVVTYVFFVGSVGQLAWYTVAPVFVLLLGIGWKHSLDVLQRFWWTPIAIPKEINWLGCLSFFLLFWVVILNFFQILTPMPTGSDAYILYVNVPGLVAEQQGLIPGYQPYNWSLFMSLGYVLYDQTEIALILSYLGGVLALWAAYRLGETWLKMDRNYILLALLLFYLLPTITHQSFRELKIDLGLLFVLLSVVLVLLDFYLHAIQKESASALPYLILMGLLTGFGLGIKLTALFFFFALLGALWYLRHQTIGYLSMMSLTIFVLLLVRFDDIGGLRQYHLSANYVMVAMLLLGLGLLAWIFLKNREKVLKTIRYSLIYGVFFLLPVLPWMTKNFVETRSLNPQLLLNGKQPGPAVSEGAIIRAWNQRTN